MKSTFDSIMTGLEQAVRHAEGEDIGTTHKINISASAIREIRAKTGLSQSQFATSIGVSTASMQNWEQGKRKPRGAARVLLALLDQDPSVIRKILSSSK